MKTDINKIKERVKNLLAVAANDASADGEIDNALRFAKALMMKYHLEDSDIPDKDSDIHVKAAIKEIKDTFVPSTGKTLTTWEVHLARFCGDFIGSVPFYMARNKKEQLTPHGTIKFDKDGKPKVGEHIVFYGADDEVDLAVNLFEEITIVVTVMARMKFGSLLRGKGRSYADGFISGLSERLAKETIKLQNDPNNSSLMVQSQELISQKLARATTYIRKKVRFTKGAGPSGKHSSDAYNSGKSDGQNYQTQSRKTTKKLN